MHCRSIIAENEQELKENFIPEMNLWFIGI